jgi:large subunit ribosomal protein L25
MYAMLILETKNREKSVNLDNLRTEGQVPAVFYGPGSETVSISVPQKEFIKMLSQAGESTVVTLKTEGGDKDVLIHDVAFHPVSELPLHVDFYLFDKTKTVEVSVPLVLEGVAPAVKLGGILIKVLHELKIEALPSNLPQEIKVDISTLTDLDSVIIAKDIPLPEGVTLMEGADEVVTSITEAKEEEEEEVVADIDSVEVAEKGKASAEGEGEEGDK